MSIKKTFIVKEASPPAKKPAAPKKDDFRDFLTKPYPDGGPTMEFAPIPKQMMNQIINGLETVEYHLSDGWDFGDRRMQKFQDAKDVIINALKMVGSK